jgi:superfamily II DNA or RNA helicase
MNKIFERKYQNWIELEKVIEGLPTNKAKGDAFEEFVHFYLKYHSQLYQLENLYSPIFTKNRFPNEVLQKLRLEKKDHGVDGVYVTKQGLWIAYQAKFRSGRQAVTYDELATFWTEAENADGRLIISNSTALPAIADKKSGHTSILCDIFDSLEEDFFESLVDFALGNKLIKNHTQKKPRPYQEEILEDIKNGFTDSDRGKLIAACGIGKTLIALWLVEDRDDQKVLFLAPNLQLIRQTLREWAREATQTFQYLCVCSDQSVDLEDESQLATSEMDVPVTTDADEISAFLSNNNKGRKVIFSTYQSVPVLSKAIKSKKGNKFDITFYDEAHRTAGVSASNLFSLAIQDSEIPSVKRLFMTATERVVKARVKNAAEELNQVVFSMDDKEKYGKTFHKLGFGKAIAQKIVSDYRIVFSGITQNFLNDYIKNNRYVVNAQELGQNDIEASQSIYRRILLKRSFSELGITKVISFHNKVSEAKAFAEQFKKDLIGTVEGSIFISQVNGSMSAQERSSYIRDFENANNGVLSNVRCLTEGVDIPLIDAVFFANPRGSLIDIVQGVGRALRQPYGASNKIAYIVIPVLIDETSGSTLTGEAFDALFNVIQALRDQDETLAEWIDQINLGAVTGKGHKGQWTGKLKVIAPPSFDVEALESSLLLKIAEVNRDPSDHVGIGSKLGKNERKSTYTRVYKTLCDYTPDKVYSALVVPTLDLITDVTATLKGVDIRVNNNNVSHCERLGIIEKIDSKTYKMTQLGINLKKGKIEFIDLFINQMLLFSYETGNGKFYPYREAFKFMRQVNELGFIDFVFGIYSLQIDPQKGVLLQEAIGAAKTIQATYPRIELTSEANKQSVLNQLNKLHPTGFPYNDVWTDRTTTGNQFRYLIRHLELFDEIFKFENRRLMLRAGRKSMIDKYLDITQSMLNFGYGDHWWIPLRNKNENN